jgi:hypothetical protein
MTLSAPALEAAGAMICVALLLLLPEAAAQAAPAEAVDTTEAAGDGNNSTAGRARGDGSSRSKLVSSIDCQICEATCRVKCLINNLFQWGGCYQRCKADNCNDWCR